MTLLIQTVSLFCIGWTFAAVQDAYHGQPVSKTDVVVAGVGMLGICTTIFLLRAPS